MEFFHVLNRGVDKRIIANNDRDRHRFMQGLYLYNDKNLLDKNTKRLTSKPNLFTERDPLVNIHAFCLMDNHYHLLLSPIDDDLRHLSAFMRKLNMGYAKYFNEKYERTGALWQGKYKKIRIENDSHFQYIPYYIHLNPLDYKFPEWRGGKLTKHNEALTFLDSYRWSSFLDYNGIKNYSSITDKGVLKNILGSRDQQKKEIINLTLDQMLISGADQLE